ncbi:MAG: hypothetical protein EXR28_16480 [Betaproteobacteria bacterium]|nr:hypothetical protein [Betaproteobacteria bacterium]
MNTIDERRRNALAKIAGLAGLAALPARAADICGTNASHARPPLKYSKLLHIDAHCHIFNADDLPVGGFLKRVVFRERDSQALRPFNPLASIIDAISQAGAVGLSEEARLLERIVEGNENLCTRFNEGWFARSAGVTDPNTGAFGYMTQPRLHNALRLTRLYPDIDLFTPALIDFDHWLKDEPRVPLYQQINLMERICIVTGGRFHAYAPFDPLRQVFAQGARSAITPLDLVKEAVGRQGFIGAKLYPPMGYKPYGNEGEGRMVFEGHVLGRVKDDMEIVTGIKPGRDRASWLRQALDSVLGDLYDWCVDEEVPIIAHCNDSNFADSRRADLIHYGEPLQWEAALNANKKWSNLKVNLGHFGRLDQHFVAEERLRKVHRRAVPEEERARIIAELKEEIEIKQKEENQFFDVVARGNGLYADLSNYDHFGERDLREDFTRNLNGWSQDARRAPVIQGKLMFGTDWHMHEDAAGRYLEDHRTAINPQRYPDYYGANAARFLGLTEGGRNRKRIEAFYIRRKINEPDWLRKIRDAKAG